MATISYVVQGIDRASDVFDRVARSADTLDAAMAGAIGRADQLNAALAHQTAAASSAAIALDKLAVSAKAASAAQDDLRKRIDAGGTSATRAHGSYVNLWALLSKKVPLFGGAGGLEIGGLHLLIDAAVELAAVWVPATVAVGAFGVAALPTLREIYMQMSAINTVTKATGQTLPPLAGGFSKVSAAVRPEVLQLWGDALTIATQKGSGFRDLATSTGHELDVLGARFAVALGHASKAGGILSEGSADVAKLGDSFASLAGIVDHLIEATPGYAGILLDIGNGILHTADVATGAALPVLKLGLAFHGAFVYIGLAVTAVLALGGPLSKLGTLLTTAGLEVAGFVEELIVADGAAATFAVTMDALGAVNPLIWVAAAAGAIAGLVVYFRSAKTAAQGFKSATQAAVSSADISKLNSVIFAGQVQTNLRLAAANRSLAATQDSVTRATAQSAVASRVGYIPALGAAQDRVTTLVSAQRQLTDEQNIADYRVGQLAKTYGSATAAQGLLNAAGITSKQLLDKSASSWAVIQQQVGATVLAYQQAHQAGGTLANDLDVISRTSSEQAQAIQKLNQAWDTWLQNVTGGENALDNFGLGMITLAKDAKPVQASIDGVNAASFTLSQQFETQINSAGTLIDSWRTAGLAGNLFAKGVRATIAPLVSTASGSREATAQLVALAQEAGYHGPANMKTLIKWLGDTTGSTRSLRNITAQATVQEALLTSAMQGQGAFIADRLIKDIDAGILAYNGVEKAARAYGEAIAQSGRNSLVASKAQGVLTNSIIKGGEAAGESKGQIAAMISKALGIPRKVAMQIVMSGEGSFKLSGEANSFFQKLNSNRSANGRMVTGGIPGVDSVPILAMPGEVVVPTNMVNAGAVDHLRGRLPGFAAGGLVDRGNRSVLSGQYLVSDAIKTRDALAGGMEAAMGEAVKLAKAAIAASSGPGGGGFGTPGPGGGNASANAALARRMMPAWGSGSEWAAWNYVAMRESGWSQFARNSSSGAYGIPQALPPSKMGPAANPPQSNPAAQISWMIGYIRGRYGDPLGAAAHERAFNWYGSGTKGAAPGLAVVGERGPEIVSMLGGEQVIPAGASARMMRGYASGTLSAKQSAGLGLAQFYNDPTNTTTALMSEMRAYLKLIAKYYDGSSAKWRDNLVKEQTTRLVNIGDKLSAINAKVAAAKSYQQSVQQGLSGYADLSALTPGAPLGATGATAAKAGNYVAKQLGTQLTNLKAFGTALKKLSAAHVSPALIRQIVALGPDEGLNYAQEILAGGSSLIKTLNTDESAISAQEKAISRGATSAVYLGKYNPGKDFLHGLTSQQAGLEKLFESLGDKLGREAAKWFDIPNKKLPVGLRTGGGHKVHPGPVRLAHGGWLNEPVYGYGASGQEYLMGENGREWVGPRGPGQGNVDNSLNIDHVHIEHIPGFTSEQDIANAMDRVSRQQRLTRR